MSKKQPFTFKKYRSFLPLIILILCAFPFVKEFNRRNSIKNEPKKSIKAVIINEKVYNGNSPVKPDFYFKYKFNVNGEEYLGESHNDKLMPGDSIDIEFVIENPSKNSPKNYYK